MTLSAKVVRASMVAATALAAMMVASPGQTAVHYLFELIGDGPVLASFSYTSADFLTADLNVAPGDLDSCAPFASGTCGTQEFHANSTGFISGMGDVYDIVGFKTQFPSSASTSFHYFTNGAFGAVGVYNAMVLDRDGSRLTVTQDQGVPEPATWALMLLGFGAAGVALRSRAQRRGLA